MSLTTRSENTQQDLQRQVNMCRILNDAPVVDSVAVCLSYLLLCAQVKPDILRTLLNEPVVREGFRGVSMITTLNRVARS